MTEIKTQKFAANWQQNHALFGQEIWEKEADFVSYIEAPLPIEIGQQLHQIGQQFKQDLNLEGGVWAAPDAMHLTITLPGRLGTHFQKNDLSFMKKTLDAITAETPAFELSIANLNVFPSTLFAEVQDPSGRLQQLHETLCNEIPFSQHPEFRYQNYLPHISLAYGVNATTPLTAEAQRNFEPINFTLDTISLGNAKWQGTELKKQNSAQYTLK